MNLFDTWLLIAGWLDASALITSSALGLPLLAFPVPMDDQHGTHGMPSPQAMAGQDESDQALLDYCAACTEFDREVEAWERSVFHGGGDQ